MGKPRKSRPVLKPVTRRKWVVTIIHEGWDPNDEETRTLRSREVVEAESDTEAVITALVRTAVVRASMGTVVLGVELVRFGKDGA